MIVDNIETLKRIVGARREPFEIRADKNEILHFTPGSVHCVVWSQKRRGNIPFRPYFANWLEGSKTVGDFAKLVINYLTRSEVKIGPFPKMAPSMDGPTLAHNQALYRPKP